MPITCLLDTGAARSCLNSNIHHLNGLKLIKEDARLICANGEEVNSINSANIKVQIGSIKCEHKFIIVPNLSCDAILGIDLINDLTISSDSNFIKINGEHLELTDLYQRKFGKIYQNTELESHSTQTIKVINPFIANKEINSLMIDSMHNDSKLKFQINSSIVKNDSEYLDVLVTTTKNSHKIFKNMKICEIIPIDLKNNLNAIRCIDDPLEAEYVQRFQEERIAKYGKSSKIEIGSIGEQLNESQRKQINETLEEFNLSFARSGSDIGSLGYFRFTLPMINEAETAYQPPRPIPPALRSQVDKEIETFQTLGIIESNAQSEFNVQ